MASITSIHEQQTVVKFITNSKMAKCSWPGCSLDTRPQNLPKERCCKNKRNKQWNAWWSQGHAATVLTCCIPISGLYEIFNEPLQTISKTYRYKKRKKPNNRITNTLTHNQECAWLIFGTKIQKKAKYQYTDEEEDTLCEEDKNTMEFRSITFRSSISLLYNLGWKLHILQNYANKRVCVGFLQRAVQFQNLNKNVFF